MIPISGGRRVVALVTGRRKSSIILRLMGGPPPASPLAAVAVAVVVESSSPLMVRYSSSSSSSSYTSNNNSSSSSTTRHLSSAAPEPLDYEEDDDEDDESMMEEDEEESGAEEGSSSMPRLKAMREKLAKEGDGGPVVLTTKSGGTSVGGGGCGTTTTSGASDVDAADSGGGDNGGMESWRKLLSQLKDVRVHGPTTTMTTTDADVVVGSAVTTEDDNNNNNQSPMLTDNYKRFHTYLRISLTERCNFRCQYCMPPEGVPLQPKDSLLTSDEIIHLVQLFASQGVDKVRLTGGEPLLRPDVSELIGRISSSVQPTLKSIGITTNGLTLSRQLPSLIKNGLTHVNISLDTLNDDKFVEITRRKGLKKVLKAIDDASEQFPAGRVKINCVVMKGFNEMELVDFIMLGKDRNVDVRFIEWMPFNDNGWNANRFFSYHDMLSTIRDGIVDHEDGEGQMMERIQDGPNDTTKWYRVPNHQGRVGFITSMSEHFCGTCNRLRITADGNLKVCLFGSDEVSLRDAMRAGDVNDDDLQLLVGAALRNKKFALGGHGNMHGIKEANDNRPMTLIGG